MTKETGSIQWSGLETPEMKEARCSLLLPIDVTYQPKIKSLPASKVLVKQDKGAKMSHNYLADFLGCTLLQLVPSPEVRHSVMPVTITVAGKCHFTVENYKDFTIMMRTHEESEYLKLPPNSEYKWPDVRSLLQCPFCSAIAKLPKEEEHEYWMVFYPLMQVVGANPSEMKTLATRTICRLVCLDCMQQNLDGMFLTVKQMEKTNAVTFSLSAMEMLQEAGTVSFLQDGPPRPEQHPHVDDPIDAWTLYTLWESTGAWEALQNDYRGALSRSLAAHPSPHEDPTERLQTKDRYGRSCGNRECDKVHGKKTSDGQITRLSVVCKQCKIEYYCSELCRNTAWTVHSLECESGKKRVKLVQCDACRMTMPHTKMKKCARCRSVVYCSVECQRGAWPRHKPMCKKT